jgi:hypothetical protein
MVDNDTLLMVAIFQKACPLDPKPSASDYIKQFGPEIETIGRVLELLGLAEPNEQCNLGWKATDPLMNIIAERVMHPSKVKDDHRNVVDSLFHVAVRGLGAINIPEHKTTEPGKEVADQTAEDDEDDDFWLDQVSDFGCDVLAALGLVKPDAVDGYNPTRLMQKLVFERFLQQYSKVK